MLRFFRLGAILLVGCGATVVAPPVTTDGGADTATPDTGAPDTVPPPLDMGPPPTPGATPPSRPGATASGGATKWFAIKRLQLGLTHRTTGAADANAWKQYGYDLDARTTTKEDSKTSNNSCKRRAGSPTNVLADGDAGRDNNFGQHLMAVVKSLKADAEDAVNSSINDGHMTILLRLDNVGPTDNASVPGAMFVAGRRGTPPKWDGTDKWPIDSSSVDAEKKPLYTFPAGYMRGGVWVSGDLGKGTALIPIPLFGPPVLMPLDGAVFSFDVESGSGGTIAGAANATKLKDAMTPMFKSFGICPGNATYEQVISTMTQSADLVSGAPLFQDTARECDALSVGVGFVAAPIAPSDTYVMAPPPPPSDCP